MTQIANWLSPETLRVLALVLLHFIWQGAALAALTYAVMALCRSASVRYAVGVGTLMLMLAAPVASFFVLRGQDESAAMALSSEQIVAAPASTPWMARGNRIATETQNAPVYFLWLVEAWFAGVVLLSLRSLGGFVVVERLRRKESTLVPQQLQELCLSLQRRMGLHRVVRYCESLRLEAPAVAGWIRPVVLLPVTAIIGLSEEELEAVIAHELAHIQRHDAFVHLFQIAVETLLFYHPAVWWLGKRIRAEREHCCDDVAVGACSPLAYVSALARMAEWKAAPQLVMAANRSPLIERIARLLDAKQRPAKSFRAANLGACVVCLLTALVAGSAFFSNVHRVQAQTPPTIEAPKPAAAIPTPRANTARSTSATSDDRQRPDGQASNGAVAPEASDIPEARIAPTSRLRFAGTNALRFAFTGGLGLRFASTERLRFAPMVTPPAEGTAAPVLTGVVATVPLATPQASPSPQKQSYIDSLKEAGLDNLSVDDLIALKVQGVTGEYVKAMKDLGLKIDANNLIGMKVQGITPEYVKGMRDITGEQLDSDALIGMKVQGITSEYVKQMHDLSLKTDAGDLIGMKVQGVTPEYVREMRNLGLKIETDIIIGMKVQGITQDYVKNMQSMGFHPDSDELIGMKVQGVTAEYIKGLQDAGFKVSIEDAIGAKIQGVTPEFIAKVQSHGFKNLTLDKIISLKISGVLDSEK
jgi:beta-lactamase regulating signal transducer with metallopeptidase domain